MVSLRKKIIPRKFTSAALDIGEREIKFVYLEPLQKVPKILTIARYSTPPDLFGDGLNEEALAGILEDMVYNYGLAGKQVISCICGDKLITRHIRLPKMPPKALKKEVMQEAEKVMPIALSDLVVRYIVLGECEVDKQLDILLAAVPLSLTYQFHSLLSRLGMVLTALDLPAIALWRLYRNELIASTEDATAIIEIGAVRTNLIVTEFGLLKFTRQLSVGGNLLTYSMADAYDIDFTGAQAMKEKNGLIINDKDLAIADPDQIRIDLSLRQGLGDLILDIRRSLEYYSARDNTKPVQSVILTGGVCKLRGFDEFMGEALNVPVKLIPPTSIDFTASGEFVFDPSLALAYGMALREVG